MHVLVCVSVIYLDAMSVLDSVLYDIFRWLLFSEINVYFHQVCVIQIPPAR